MQFFFLALLLLLLLLLQAEARFGFGSLDFILLEFLCCFLVMCTRSKQKLMKSNGRVQNVSLMRWPWANGLLYEAQFFHL